MATSGHEASRGQGISLINVTKTYGRANAPAVSDISLDVQPGEFMTLLGPSGSGKTTALSLVAGLTTADSGTITIGGRDVGRLKTHQRNLGVVFQHYALFPNMTVARNVAYPLERRQLPKTEIRARVERVLHTVGLEGLEDRLPSELSGGQQQRVAVARAVVYEPAALLLDEPLSALDKKLRQTLQAELVRLHRELGLTFLFVTHDQDEAMPMSDRIAVFNHGKIQQVDSPEKIYSSPASKFVANFLGDCNLLAGRVEGGTFGWSDRLLRLGDRDVVSRAVDATLMVRPERASIASSQDQVPAGASSVDAVVVSSDYIGDRVRLTFRLQTGEQGLVYVSPYEAPLPAAGDAVWVHWNPRDQKILTE